MGASRNQIHQYIIPKDIPDFIIPGHVVLHVMFCNLTACHVKFKIACKNQTLMTNGQITANCAMTNSPQFSKLSQCHNSHSMWL